ncbi:hypothetical protein M2324_003800 [Rhodovulum sulfidophilum]|uniref:hypothetical protein n=1 Tax=Rhodovulum sulfidophilum TaxID=35806 RepID=UPI000AB60829|nr:hypothetical protein [Rhodovulum sulfidophilum]MCW2305378.1 hypothetical protein [Rhodovulum sulfidophilum]
MFETLLDQLSQDETQRTLTWLGGGLVVGAGGLWTVVKYFWSEKSSGEGKTKRPPDGEGREVLAGNSGLAAGGNVHFGNNVTVRKGIGRDGVWAICLGGLGCLLLAGAFAGNNIQTDNGSLATGGDISGSTITINNSNGTAQPGEAPDD